jgi:AraC-like DNA-binding protein
MIYNQVQPPQYLKSHVRYFWTLEHSGPARSFKTIADGSPGIIFHRSDKGTFFQNERPLPQLFLFGQPTAHAEITVSTSTTVGVCLYPNALHSVFGIDADVLTDSCTNINDLPKTTAWHLEEQLLNAGTMAEQMEILSAFLFAQIQRNARHDDVAGHVLSWLIRANGNVPLKEVQQHLQLSERTLERRFKKAVGISPKLFARICGFQAALSQLNGANFDKLSDIAYQNGYADQSHFIRSFKQFTGLSPYQYQKQADKIANLLPG